MNFSFAIGNKKYTIQANTAKKIEDGILLQSPQVNISLPSPAKSFYRHGWQSWSLAAWLPTDFQIPVQKPAILHPLQIDPLYAKHPAPNGSWLGAVRFGDGNVLLLGALGLDAHVALHKNELRGWFDEKEGEWVVTYGQEIDVFRRYANLLGDRLGRAPVKPNPRIWCSWYSLYNTINQSGLDRIINDLGDLPFDVIQVDDGWQKAIGDWGTNNKFPEGISIVAEKIKATGRQAGLWLAPLIAVKSSRLFKENPDWFLKDIEARYVSAGFNWAEPLYALDTTHPEVLDWLAALMRQVRAWGFNYLKLDFLYAGALPGIRHNNMPRESAYRHGIKVLRDAMGEDAYFLACGAPIIPSIGLCDAIRIGPDVADIWERYRDAVLLYNPTTPGTKNAIRTSVSRLWLNPLVATDPDVAYFRSQNNSMNSKQKRMLQDLALVCNFKATSDLPDWLNADERKALNHFLELNPKVKQTDRYSYLLDERHIDFSPAILLPEPPRGFDSILSAIIGWAGNQPWILKMLDKQG
jgi:alpha-galactosidase